MDVFNALAEPTRRHIVEMLAKRGQLSASDIHKKFRMSAPAISQHLKILREAKLVSVQKLAQKRMYQMNPESLMKLEEWIQHTTRLWNDRFEKLGGVLEALKVQNRKDS